ncbi:M20 family metallopeptidase [Burkholderia vietnamiensis]|uniref:M20 family metallopeptidase n=1 Tax=Burkholderia vietnamiensis TaxID=60552 RepID=A0AAW7SWZ6_BURVI|nr:M20 family metallopeptidase [Burkholderia vietnamiensis]MBH9645812.1 amidohydrolase [Burkholderia vietnamiensis]MBR8008914.1 amidohydrolase [Burkholderia vietnamiensis]MDN7551267.1 M20 family metallopeptidase [Burkholderia vietnamiensis]MDN7795081.1 M20 family metallopeptidase [Burkholderia vietnamiensis]MDN8073782.1 M20 family metallopeptidase [Burkholderia vietnamiensis]
MTSLALDFIDSQRAQFTELSDRIWNLAELRYEEFASTDLHIRMLEEAGFRVTRGVADIPTAFVAEAGDGGPVIGILGEYDALSGLSQEAGVLTCQPSSEISNGNGHGCGHHLLGTAAHLAAAAVKVHLERTGQPGTVRFYGCPAEEGGSGKTFMARTGVFDDLDAALSWHPHVYTGIFPAGSLANIQAYFRFTGKASHAAASPHLGRSALDAVELMNVGVNYLREHMLPEARVHYAVTNTGGLSPNVVQANAEVLYLVRAARNDQAAELFERVKNVARGAALMTDCQLEIVFDKACSNLLENAVLNQVMYRHLQSIGTACFDADDAALADAYQRQTLTTQDIETSSRSLNQAWRDPKALFDGIDPYEPGKGRPICGSTDVGDVSWVTPTAQCHTSCYAFGTPPHSWQWVAQGKAPLAHKGMLLAAKTMASTAIDLLAAPDTLARAKAELLERRGGRPYVCPIPDDVALPFRR